MVPDPATVDERDLSEADRPSRRWAQPHFSDLRYWHEADKGGHFAALEQPAIFVDEVRAAFRQLR